MVICPLQMTTDQFINKVTEIWPKILKEFKAPATDPSVIEELEAYMVKRKELLGKEEPLLEFTE